MVDTNGEANATKVRKMIEEVCSTTGASVVIEEHLDGADKTQPAGQQSFYKKLKAHRNFI